MRWRPAHENHAIERVILTLQFSEQIPQKTFAPLLAAANARLSGMDFEIGPDHIEFGQMGTLHLGANAQVVGGLQPPHAAPIAGRSFRKMSEGQIRDEVVIQRGYLSYAVTLYERWADYRERAFQIFGAVLTGALDVADVTVIKLEYWDRFVFDGTASDVDYSELLRSESKLFAKFGVGTQELWHSHVGYLTEAQSGAKRLVNFNIDVLDLTEVLASPEEPPALLPIKRSVGLYSLAQDTFNSPPADSASIGSCLDDMHIELNGVLSDAITPEAAQRISLNIGAPK